MPLIAGAWFVNLVNFMDGIDWITLAGLVPLSGAVALAGKATASSIPSQRGCSPRRCCGGLIGFAPFNQAGGKASSSAMSGRLPLGLLGAYLLYRLSPGRAGALTAALILPLYACDGFDHHAASGAVWRAAKSVWQAHRSHFYQQATDNGLSR